jgi:hypothetical protein
MNDIIQPHMGLNFGRVWAVLIETHQQIKETQRGDRTAS